MVYGYFTAAGSRAMRAEPIRLTLQATCYLGRSVHDVVVPHATRAGAGRGCRSIRLSHEECNAGVELRVAENARIVLASGWQSFASDLSVTDDTLVEAPLASMREGRKLGGRARTTAPDALASIFGRAYRPKHVIAVCG